VITAAITSVVNRLLPNPESVKKVRYLLALIALVLLSCQSGKKSSLDGAYADSLAAILGESVAPFSSSLENYPRKRAVQVELRETRIGFFDMFNYDGCGLADLLAQRNSILGKVMPASERLLYEWRFFNEAGNCLAGIDSSNEPLAYQNLHEYKALKRDNLLPALWNATFAAEEFQRCFSLGDPGETTSAEIAALSFSLLKLSEISASLSTANPGPPQTMDKYLVVIRRGGVMGPLLADLEQTAHTLNALSDLLENALDSGVSPADLQRLSVLYEEFYTKEVDAHIELLSEKARRVLTPVNRMYAVMRETSPDSFRTYFNKNISLTNPDALWHQLEIARLRHQQQWRKVMDAAGGEIIVI